VKATTTPRKKIDLLVVIGDLMSLSRLAAIHTKSKSKKSDEYVCFKLLGRGRQSEKIVT
jgi:hypothetical protein